MRFSRDLGDRQVLAVDQRVPADTDGVDAVSRLEVVGEEDGGVTRDARIGRVHRCDARVPFGQGFERKSDGGGMERAA